MQLGERPRNVCQAQTTPPRHTSSTLLLHGCATRRGLAWPGFGQLGLWMEATDFPPTPPWSPVDAEKREDLFRSSSEFLHKATNGRVYFKHVTIEVPKTWPKRASARALSSGFFEKSDVRVDQPSAPHGDKPYTMQKRRCGEPGDFIQVTPAFLATMGNSTAKKLVNPAYVMVHEWAHYRYGVFDEYGSADDSRYPLTYCHHGKVKLNACSNRIAFTAKMTNGENCKIDRDCRFTEGCVVSLKQPTRNPVESSIMFMPYLANVSQFCDDNDGPNVHNPFAPSKQNHLCKQQSTWKVITSNADFQKLSRPDPSKSIRVTFEEAQQKEDLAPRVVLVLDVSGSMDLLTTASETPEGATIVLMSDGEENQDPSIEDMLPKVTASKVVVSTLALGATADNRLEELATSTRGKAFAFSDLKGNIVDELESAFVSSTTTQHDPVSRAHTLIESEEEFTRVFEKKFHVDADVGNATVVRVTRNLPQTGTIEARLTDPSDQPCQECRTTANGNEVVISIPSPAKVGMWTLHVESSSSSNIEISVSVKSQASKANDEPIRVSCEMGGMLVDRPDGAVIYAKVTKGTKIVLDAVVFANVYHPDTQANDGTYSGYFVQFTGKGRYAVTAHVSQQKTTRLAEPRGGSGSFFSTALFSASTTPTTTTTGAMEPASEYPISDFEMVNSTGQATNATGEEVVEPFERVASGGSFQVTEDIVQKQVPPGDIRDFAVIGIRPGVNDSIPTSCKGTSTHYPPGSKHTVTAYLPRILSTLRPDGALEWSGYLAARVSNAEGLHSKTSNVVKVSHVTPPVTTTVAPTTTEVTTTVATTTTASTTEEATTTEVTTTVGHYNDSKHHRGSDDHRSSHHRSTTDGRGVPGLCRVVLGVDSDWLRCRSGPSRHLNSDRRQNEPGETKDLPSFCEKASAKAAGFCVVLVAAHLEKVNCGDTYPRVLL
ncbi:hypothetical protein MTO96_024260 [Rhipicephalus appendiculatus]